MWRSKVLWSEGLFLRPQHFQQQERYLEALIDQRAKAIAPYGWGFDALEIDASALSIGRLQLVTASGVLPDGTAFRAPLDQRPPDPLEIDPAWKDVLLYLAVPLDRPGVPNSTLQAPAARAPFRYAAEVSDLIDGNEGFSEPAPVQLAALRMMLVAEPEMSGAYAAMPLARLIERRADGQVMLDTQFVAPSLSCQDNAVLRGYLGELRGLLRQRIDALAGRMAQPGRGGVAEIADFLLLQTVNRYSALFEHMANVPRLHPERLYGMALALAGDLATFGPERKLVKPFPAYDHDDLQLVFRPVLDNLRLALSMVLEQLAIPIELHDRKYGVRVAVIPDKQLLSTASFVLAVNAQMPAEALRLRFPTQTKVGPVEKIRDLVNLNLAGVGLRALPVAPRQIPYHAGFNYFELDTRHELWRQLDASGGLAMHIAGEFPGIELEFWAVRG